VASIEKLRNKLRLSVVSTDDEALAVTVMINGERCTYALGDSYHFLRRAMLARRFSPGQQLNWIKRRGRLVR